MELLGLWLALTGLLLPLAALGRWGWIGLALALATVAVPLLEVRFLRPTVTALVRHPARNLEVGFPSPQPRQEAILCAHLDAKTELLDHAQRAVLLRLGRPAMGLAVVAGLFIALEGLLPPGTARLAAGWLAALVALPVAAYDLGMGANLVGGRFSPRPSTGTVDNGAAVAVLLEMALRLRRGDLRLKSTTITFLFTVGEEAQMQGALAYVRHRGTAAAARACAINLEVVGQNGGYLLWEQDGTAMIRLAANAALNEDLARAIEAVSGEPPRRAPLVNSDAFAFLRAGIPAATLGSYDAKLGGRGYHSALDNVDRLDAGRLAETVEVLCRFLEDLDDQA
jgi:hypothetical protein